eukprot:6181662-Pleurochrysis_carterae.AAC.2
MPSGRGGGVASVLRGCCKSACCKRAARVLRGCCEGAARVLRVRVGGALCPDGAQLVSASHLAKPRRAPRLHLEPRRQPRFERFEQRRARNVVARVEVDPEALGAEAERDHRVGRGALEQLLARRCEPNRTLGAQTAQRLVQTAHTNTRQRGEHFTEARGGLELHAGPRWDQTHGVASTSVRSAQITDVRWIAQSVCTCSDHVRGVDAR